MTHTTVDSERDSLERDDAPQDAARELGELNARCESIDQEPEESVVEDRRREKKSKRLQISVSIRSVSMILLITVLIGASATFAWLYFGAKRETDAMHRQAANDARAEKVALDYAVAAAEMNFKDLNAWKTKLVAGTSPELKAKLTDAATSMAQILVPLEWTSTARPLASKVRSDTNGVFVVDSFVRVLTKTSQSQDPLQSTATYSITIDSAKNWLITDVGGLGAAVGEK
ncbi:hypothetical protein [Mycobacterium marseillense]|uniref:Mce-associated membrane protein n=1 Tax=Mycobacterium marseillense TaxID=701042 RepID=A0ABM7JFA8_9MYCO|nr:hypothetical protein [Mycobacterium marseillense]MCV7406375.1 hypothetical protein [Mycobacterium marseillense]ORA89567.1 hypothetical protein BST31_18070 [Mycobacterium marseillense]BBY12544.1 hypothetical protein MMARJ_32840 [Mycobacterium marseillense]